MSAATLARKRAIVGDATGLDATRLALAYYSRGGYDVFVGRPKRLVDTKPTRGEAEALAATVPGAWVENRVTRRRAE